MLLFHRLMGADGGYGGCRTNSTLLKQTFNYPGPHLITADCQLITTGPCLLV